MDLSNLIHSAGVAHASGRLAEASRMCREALEVEPYNAQATLLLGVIEAKVGDPVTAIRLLDEVQGMDPNSFNAVFWQSHAFKKIGRSAEALEAAKRAVELHPQDPQAITQLGICYQDVRLLSDAEGCLRTAMGMAPHVTPIQFNLSQCLLMQGRKAESIELLRQAIVASGQNAESLLKLAQFLLTQGNSFGAAECARYALELDPGSVVAKLVLGRILIEDNRAEEAEKLLQAAVAQGAADGQAQGVLGMALQGLGRLDEAVACFQASIDLVPVQGFAYFALFNSKRVSESDRAMIQRMKTLAAEAEIPAKQVSYLQYGLGKALEDLSDFPGAMVAFDEANRIERDLKFRGREFDREAHSDAFDRTIRQFSASFLAKNKGVGSVVELPIFVVGMIRSGTTLVEQLLSCHPRVGAAGELAFWPDNWREGFSEKRGGINAEGIRRIAERYEGLLIDIAPEKDRVVDKMPVNFAGLGIIHTAFPNAKIIHTRRNPIDTCLSIYTTPNRASNDYAHDRGNIVFAYRQYLRIMEHWRKVLPAGSMLEIDYESLVADSESTTRQIVDFCGLEWNDACLKPHENKRAVVTPSVWQVRQPFYLSSVNRWRRFEPWLGEFLDLLPSQAALTESI